MFPKIHIWLFKSATKHSPTNFFPSHNYNDFPLVPSFPGRAIRALAAKLGSWNVTQIGYGSRGRRRLDRQQTAAEIAKLAFSAESFRVRRIRESGIYLMPAKSVHGGIQHG